MHTEYGNEMVHRIVVKASWDRSTWPEVYSELEKLSKGDRCRECLDTVVREDVYDALNFKSAFYL